MVEHILSTSFDNIEDFGKVGLDNSSEDLNRVDPPEVEVYSLDKTSCWHSKVSLNNFGRSYVHRDSGFSLQWSLRFSGFAS